MYLIVPSAFTVVVPWAGAVVTRTDAGFSGAPFTAIVSLASTVVVTGVFCGVVSLSSTAVTALGTVTVTSADAQIGVGVEVSHTR